MKELLEDIKLSRIAYYLEKIQKTNNIDTKIKFFEKIQKYKISKKIGLYLIENSIKDFGIEDDLGGINSSLIELCFKDYYFDYNDKIKEIFKDLNNNAQNRILNLLTTINDASTIKLYADLVVKFYKNRDIIPIGDLPNKPLAYPYLFPKLYKTLKFDSKNNNVLILISDYLNAGTVVKEDLNKNKKVLTDSICDLFQRALSYDFKNTYDALHDPEYKDLRYFLELAVNIEFYISSKRTKNYLTKLLKKNDNQLKLFILDNYIRKEEKLTDFNFNEIAKDKASRYALFELLTVYEKNNLMPKRYNKQKLIAESDFYTNFVISTSYTNEPEKLKYFKTIIKDNLEYYIFKFNAKYKFNNLSNDYLINYIYNQIGIQNHVNEDIIGEFIGISGGYKISDEATLVVKNHNKLLFSIIDSNTDIDKLVDDILTEKKEYISIENTNKTNKKKKSKLKKEKIKKERKKLFKKKEKQIEEKLENTEVEVKVKKQYHIFSYFLLFLFAVFLGLLIYCLLYIYGVGSINDGISQNIRKAVRLNETDKFIEIPADQIFNQAEAEYFVLLYSDVNKETNKYYLYINEYTKRDNKLYYVDLNKEENKFLYGINAMNFTLYTDRLLKVKDHEYEYYIDGKNNIINEMETQIEKIINQEKEEAKQKKK